MIRGDSWSIDVLARTAGLLERSRSKGFRRVRQRPLFGAGLDHAHTLSIGEQQITSGWDKCGVKKRVAPKAAGRSSNSIDCVQRDRGEAGEAGQDSRRASGWEAWGDWEGAPPRVQLPHAAGLEGAVGLHADCTAGAGLRSLLLCCSAAAARLGPGRPAGLVGATHNIQHTTHNTQHTAHSTASTASTARHSTAQHGTAQHGTATGAPRAPVLAAGRRGRGRRADAAVPLAAPLTIAAGPMRLSLLHSTTTSIPRHRPDEVPKASAGPSAVAPPRQAPKECTSVVPRCKASPQPACTLVSPHKSNIPQERLCACPVCYWTHPSLAPRCCRRLLLCHAMGARP